LRWLLQRLVLPQLHTRPVLSYRLGPPTHSMTHLHGLAGCSCSRCSMLLLASMAGAGTTMVSAGACG
jgi:hypothetical protein